MTKPSDITIHMIGHGHIDPTWLWRWTEGYEEVRATFRSALDRMNETPTFKFTATSACFYSWVKACDPAMFDEIRARVKEGRWEIAGGWWIEPDCNIPAGESFVRQGLYGLRFFQQEFGVRVRVGFNPDSFGHAGTFPQLFKKMGIDYYAYQRPEPVKEMQYPDGTTFWWEANDGSKILATNLLESYNAEDELLDRIQRFPASPHLNAGQSQVLVFFGVGNHGGGPSKRAIAQILDLQRARKGPKIRFSTLHEYFDAFSKSIKTTTVSVIARDLQHHAQGCYTTHAEIKRLNRRAEHALMSAERLATACWLTTNHAYPQDTLERAWKDLLYNQFHDILAGTSLESSYEDARDQLGAAKHAAQVVRNEAIQVLARNVDTTAEGNTIMLVNPLPWAIRQTVTVPPITARCVGYPLHIVDDNDETAPSQQVLDERIGSEAYVFTADVPALGYRCYHARPGAVKTKGDGKLKAGRDFIENKWWRIEFDPSGGHISRLLDKKKDVEVLRKGNILAAIVDSSDTWGHGFDEYRNEAGRFEHAALELLEHGDVRATVRVRSRFRDSHADQFVTLYRADDTIDSTFRINWQEQYTMLKLAYETNIADGTATYDTAYGCQVRNTEGWEEPGQKWIDLTGNIGGKTYGLAILNDGKYGFDVRRDHMRVTLLRSPAYAHHDRKRYEANTHFPIMDQGWHTIRIRLMPHAGDWTDAAVVRKAWELNEPTIVHVESAHPGALPARWSFLECDAENVALTVLKKAEDSDSIVIRGYETEGQSVKTTIRLPQLGKTIRTDFARHEIKTLLVSPKTGRSVQANLLEEKAT